MATFLVIHFDRYDTEDSTHSYIEANNHKEAIIKSYGESADDGLSDYIDGLIVVKRDFASIAEEESDILCYKLKSIK